MINLNRQQLEEIYMLLDGRQEISLKVDYFNPPKLAECGCHRGINIVSVSTFDFECFHSPLEADKILMLEGYRTEQLQNAINEMLDEHKDAAGIKISRNVNSIIISPILPRESSLLVQYQKGMI